MTWLTDNKKYAVFLTYVVLLIIFIIATVIVYKLLPDAKELQGALIGWDSALVIQCRGAAKDFGFGSSSKSNKTD